MKIMSAGPTSVSKRVINAYHKPITNSDLDKNYVIFHREVEKKYSKLLKTNCTSFIMLGEAMLGLDGACASIMEKDDKVLVITNGIFGKGFFDFAKMYGANPTLFEGDLREGININDLREFLKDNHDFKCATLVHCETPSGISNDIKAICNLLNEYGIISIVDSVSGVLGEYIDFDDFKIDCLIGGTQKCISAPPGLTLITLSEKCKNYILSRNDIPSFYSNFKNYIAKGEDFSFPYTMNDSLVYALDEALNEISESDFVNKHKSFAEKTRKGLIDSGLELYPRSYHANTVTTFLLPKNVDSSTILDKMMDRGFIISASFGHLSNIAIRIGHMGNNISKENEKDFIDMLINLQAVLEECNVSLKDKIYKYFI